MRLRIGLRVPVAILGSLALFALGSSRAVAQGTGNIQGTVTNSDTNEPLEAAQVFIPGTQFGTLTDSRGRYLLLRVPEGQHTVNTEVIGYEHLQRVVNVTAGQTVTLDFAVKPTALKINQIVVTGVVGSTPKSEVPFDVDKVDASDLPVPTVNAESAIQGQVAGAHVVQGSGAPGSSPDVLLRGATSIDASGRSQAPLYIVDGVIVDPANASPLADINALDIKSIEVVKGAAAASLYGSRAANGVIQITTKRGTSLQQNTSRYTFRAEYGRSTLPHEISLAMHHPWKMNASQTAFLDANGNEHPYSDSTFTLQLDATNPNNPAYTAFQDNPYVGTLYDQVARFFNPGNYVDTYLSVEGRHAGTNYYVSFDNTDQSGVVRYTDGYRRQNFRVNVDHGLTQDLQLSVSSFYSTAITDNSNGDFFSLTFATPTTDLLAHFPTNSTNPLDLIDYLDPHNSEESNPIYSALNLTDRTKTQRFMGSTDLKYAPVGWFNLEGNLSYDRTDDNRSQYYPKGYRTRQGSSLPQGNLHKWDTYQDELNGSVVASVQKAFGDFTTRNKVQYLFESDNYNAFDANGNNLAVKNVPSLDVVNGTKTLSSQQTAVRSAGYFFITGLTYKDKYIFDGLVRRDGSSLFGSQARWATYYRVSGALRLSRESWWPFQTALPEFKLRASYGTAGGRPNFYAQYETYSVSGGAVQPQTLGNKDLKPELDKELEVGLDALILNRVSASLTYAKDIAQDQILRVPLPGYAGFHSQWRNAGTLETKSYEATLESELYRKRDMNWSARLLVDKTSSVITALGVPPFQFGPGNSDENALFYARKGEKYGTMYGHRFATSCKDLPQGTSCDGFQVNDDGYLVYVGTGNTYKDGISKSLWGTTSTVNGASYNWGIPFYAQDANGNTFLPIGNTTPKYNASLSTTFNWKGFSLYGLLDSSQGFTVYNQTAQWNMREYRAGVMDQSGKPDALKKPVGYYNPALYDVNAYNSYFAQDGSFVKLRQISLSYTLDKTALDALRMGGLNRVTLNLIGKNLYTWTNYTGYDPEVGQGGGGLGSAVLGRVDDYSYPNFRTVTASVEVVF
jgi:TonB-linked SusC/RagA family outer membrane protein